jgi:hypothetical protein
VIFDSSGAAAAQAATVEHESQIGLRKTAAGQPRQTFKPAYSFAAAFSFFRLNQSKVFVVKIFL